MKKVIAIVLVSVFFMSCSSKTVDTKSKPDLKLTSFVKVFNQWSILEEGQLASKAEFEHIVTFFYDPNGKSSVQVKNDVSPITQIYRQYGEIESKDGIYAFRVKDVEGRIMMVTIREDNSNVMIFFTNDYYWVYDNSPTGTSASL